MAFLSFLVLLGIAYLVWRVTDQLPDLVFRLSEIQRDVAELRRRAGGEEAAGAAAASTQDTTPEPAATESSDEDSADADATASSEGA